MSPTTDPIEAARKIVETNNHRYFDESDYVAPIRIARALLQEQEWRHEMMQRNHDNEARAEKAEAEVVVLSERALEVTNELLVTEAQRDALSAKVAEVSSNLETMTKALREIRQQATIDLDTKSPNRTTEFSTRLGYVQAIALAALDEEAKV